MLADIRLILVFIPFEFCKPFLKTLQAFHVVDAEFFQDLDRIGFDYITRETAILEHHAHDFRQIGIEIVLIIVEINEFLADVVRRVDVNYLDPL